MPWHEAPVVALLLCVAPSGCASPAAPSGPAGSCNATLPDGNDCSSAAPSYSGQIAALVSHHCLDCHYAGNPNSSVVLETQSEIFRQRQLVETEIYRCAMPPSDGPSLSDADRSTILKWLVCDAPNN